MIGALTIRTACGTHKSDPAIDHWAAIDTLSRFAQVKEGNKPKEASLPFSLIS